MTKTYLDCLTIPPKFLRSVLTVLYHLLILQRAPRITDYHLTLDKYLEMPYPEIGNEDMAQMIRQQIDKVLLSLDYSREQTLLFNFKVFTENKKQQSRLLSFLKASVETNSLEEFDFPVTIAHQAPNLGLLAAQVRDRMNKILQHLQKDNSVAHIRDDLKFELSLRRGAM